jgi:uncharacterized coiled-coil protein SlyX
VKRAVESAQAARFVELESLVMLQAQKIAELKAACADLKCEKESVMASYRRLSNKHITLVEKADRENAELGEAHATELAKVYEELDKETQEYTDYRLNMWHCLHDLRGVVDSTFGEVKAWCLPFLDRNAKVEKLIDQVVGEVKIALDIVWQLNDNFIILSIEGVMNMLNGTGCQELSHLRGLAASSNASVVQNVPNDVRRLAGRHV